MPIALSTEEWARIARWTDPGKDDADAARRRQRVKYLDETSNLMTKTWPNSLENVNKRNEELRLGRIEAAERANSDFYRDYVKRKQEEQRLMMHSARNTIFKNKDAPKLLLSAVIETVIQKEREEQRIFQRERRREQDEQKRLDDANVIAKAREADEANALKAKRRREVNKQHQKYLLNQINEMNDRNLKEHESELHMQRIDNLKANEQMADIKEFEDNFKAAEKARIWADIEEANRNAEEKRQVKAAQDHLDDQLTEVLMRSRARIVSKRIRTEKEVQAQKLRVLEAIGKKLQSGEAARDEAEQKARDKAIREKEEAEEAKREAMRLKLEKFRAERVAVREQFLRDEAGRIHKKETERKWEMMNRFKNAEIFEDFKENLRKQRALKIQQYREDILKLKAERDEREARELAERRYFYGELAEKRLREADRKLLAYASMLMDEARVNKRPDYALQRAVDGYCKMYRLYPMPPLPNAQQEHFVGYEPQDHSNPEPYDPSCFGDRPPPKDPQEPVNVVQEKLPPKVEKPVVVSSKEKANGLQAKPKKRTVPLPCIVMACPRSGLGAGSKAQ